MSDGSWSGRLLSLLGVRSGEELEDLVARAGSASLAIKVAAAGLAFLLQMLLARVLGPAEYGDYTYVLTWVSVIGLVCAAGMDTTAVRFVSKYTGTESWAELRGLRRRLLQIVGVLSALGAILIAGTAWLARDAITAGLATVFVLGAVLLPVNVLLNVSTSILQGLKRAVAAMAPTGVLRPVLLGSAVLLWVAFAPRRLDAEAAVTLNLLAALAVLTVVGHLVRKSLPERARSREPVYETRRWVTVALPLLLVSGMHLLIQRTDILMIGAFVGTEAAGLYTVGSRAAELAAFGLMGANVILAPVMSELESRSEGRRLQRIFTLGARASFAFALIVLAGLALVGEPVLGLFGEAFRRAYGPMLILASAQTAGAFIGSVGYLMTMTGHEREMSIVLAAAAAANVALNALLIPPFGLRGAAAATALSMVVWNVTLAVVANRRLGIRPTAAAAIGGDRA